MYDSAMSNEEDLRKRFLNVDNAYNAGPSKKRLAVSAGLLRSKVDRATIDLAEENNR